MKRQPAPKAIEPAVPAAAWKATRSPASYSAVVLYLSGHPPTKASASKDGAAVGEMVPVQPPTFVQPRSPPDSAGLYIEQCPLKGHVLHL
mmetsp:Transcript_24968/g.59337  ORF Transcript_24968/g.59337 Transcript_24968/m.59337 type:complete len:90 (-) Transcript_24968:453-722(-)